MTILEKFLAEPGNSRCREYLLTTRLVHDLSVAAAGRGYDLLVYLPTVDGDGFDVILDDRDRLVPIQLKSIIRGGKVAGWNVHRSLIRPKAEEADLYGFELSPSGSGRGGAVIVTTVWASDTAVHVSYAYTDIDVLSALWLGLISRPDPQERRIKRFRADLQKDPSGVVELPRSAFVAAASPEHLLALAGLYSPITTAWRLQLRTLLRHMPLRGETPAPLDVLRKNIMEGIIKLAAPSP